MPRRIRVTVWGENIHEGNTCPQISRKDGTCPLTIKGPRMHKTGAEGFRSTNVQRSTGTAGGWRSYLNVGR
jgi:trehalose utilization protein